MPSVKGWEKYKVREAIVGAITGSLTVPRTLLLGRYDDEGRLQYVGRTTTLARTAGSTSPVCSLRHGADTPGRVGRSPPGGAARRA
ncbi:hypothetical protein N7U49_47200 [Streptomyces sp. AD2-2]|nr:hypothetical protein N7U49_47200 [Streptomyces sp. AD2-2]